MGLLLVCILFNSYIAIIFKFFVKYQVRTLQAIIVNYLACIITASIVLGKPAITSEVFQSNWSPYAFALGICFVIIFNVFAITVQKFGVVIGTIFQKMSLVSPAIVAILMYDESAGGLKILGILLALFSIVVISTAKKSNKEERADQSRIAENKPTSIWLWIFPIVTFIGSCMIDTGLYFVNVESIANSTDIDFVAAIFFFAGCAGIFLVLWDYFRNGVGFRWKEVWAGFALGVPNFFSIYLLLKVLANGMDGSVVFPINNVGVLLGSAILGILFFREQFNFQKTLGFLMAISSIVLVAIG